MVQRSSPFADTAIGSRHRKPATSVQVTYRSMGPPRDRPFAYVSKLGLDRREGRRGELASGATRPRLRGMSDQSEKSEPVWEQCLTPEQFRILREKGTEGAFTGKYWDSHEDAMYVCAGCGKP